MITWLSHFNRGWIIFEGNLNTEKRAPTLLQPKTTIACESFYIACSNASHKDSPNFVALVMVAWGALAWPTCSVFEKGFVSMCYMSQNQYSGVIQVNAFRAYRRSDQQQARTNERPLERQIPGSTRSKDPFPNQCHYHLTKTHSLPQQACPSWSSTRFSFEKRLTAVLRTSW